MLDTNGEAVGSVDGTELGFSDGAKEGTSDGSICGVEEGAVDGKSEGAALGSIEGSTDAAGVVGFWCHRHVVLASTLEGAPQGMQGRLSFPTAAAAAGRTFGNGLNVQHPVAASLHRQPVMAERRVRPRLSPRELPGARGDHAPKSRQLNRQRLDDRDRRAGAETKSPAEAGPERTMKMNRQHVIGHVAPTGLHGHASVDSDRRGTACSDQPDAAPTGDE